MTPGKNKNKQNEKVSPLATPSASVPPATSPEPTRDKGKNKQRENVAPSVAPKSPRQKPEKPKNESIVSPPLDAAPKNAPRVAPPPPPPETKRNQPGPDATNPEAGVEKPKKEPPADIPKPKKEQAPTASPTP